MFASIFRFNDHRIAGIIQLTANLIRQFFLKKRHIKNFIAVAAAVAIA